MVKKVAYFLILNIKCNSQMREHNHTKSFLIRYWSEGMFLMDLL